MNILEEIIKFKKKEVDERKTKTSVHQLESSGFFERKTLSLKSFVSDRKRSGIIAEFKRRSPSKGVINNRSAVAEVTGAYALHGASGLSVLTDQKYFGGSPEDLIAARINPVPVLRKDFTIDEYQVIEAKAIGADVILLIAACLTPSEVKSLARTAKDLELEVLLELHDENEVDHICDEVDLIGVNNRNLKTFSVDLDQSIRLAEKIGHGKLKIAESGIHDHQTIHHLRQNGFDGFLMGEYFMKQEDPGAAFKNFVALITKN
jgi:indole-3-glycerol phosphate synthase